MSELTPNQKSARRAHFVGLFGALAILAAAAWASYVMKGEVLWTVMGLAAFTATFHYIGCWLFVKHFKSLDDEQS